MSSIGNCLILATTLGFHGGNVEHKIGTRYAYAWCIRQLPPTIFTMTVAYPAYLDYKKKSNEHIQNTGARYSHRLYILGPGHEVR